MDFDKKDLISKENLDFNENEDKNNKDIIDFSVDSSVIEVEALPEVTVKVKW
ncbi:hypothetical protein [Anaerococcus sp. HMSC075B03]|uniref:hypothetical protein n=1 Tax=Anaerococcus sp. HMSC075B03 TaxID=1739537 RepID=UPI000A44A62D|nr:hypothetical protein [Anaerococcus sp. HMSC075B03]